MQFRGYTMMVVLVLGLVLASLSSILLYATGRDRSESRQQHRSVSAVYAAEAGVAVGVEMLRAALEETLAPDLPTLEAEAKALAESAIPGVVYDTFSIKYYDPATNTTMTTPPAAATLSTIASGQNKGLKAQQTPIQVLAVARFQNAVASIADAVRIDLIPIFQFAIFFDGDLEAYRPAPMDINGRVHTNGDLYLSNGADVDFLSKVTVAKKIHSHASVSTSVTVGSDASATRFNTPLGTLTAIANNLPRATDAQQKSYLEATYGSGDANQLGDVTVGVEPLNVPLRLSSAATCETDANCSGDRACVKLRASDTSGVCMDRIVSRPGVCSDGSAAKFPQSLAIEVIKRPRRADSEGAYAGDGAESNPYDDDIDNDNHDVYTADFGPRPAITGAMREGNDLFEVEVPRSVPELNITEADDDPGAINDRMWWKADIRIIDGVWYKKGSTTPVWNPERVDYTSTAPSPNDLNHKFARVLRYSWWWDAREGRVLCESATSSGSTRNCVTDGNEYHRGQQIRSADFDVAEFMALLADSNARNLLFPGGVIPSGGIIVYMSETFDAKLLDANTKLPRAANVRNFLNFPYMHNHLTTAQIANPTAPLPARVAPSPRYRDTDPPPPTPYQIGFYPENIWGRNAPAPTHRSLATPPPPTTIDVYRIPPEGVATDCVDPSTLTSARQPAARPTAFDPPVLSAPCIRPGVTPLGAENAVRIVRAQTVPAEGFTFVTDNRLYLHGDINVRANNTTSTVPGTAVKTNQDVPGKVAFLADSITILSDAFDDRARQNGDSPRLQSFHKAPDDATLRTFTSVTDFVVPWGTIPGNDGRAPNLCSNSIGASQAVATRINASLLMGDVPACLNKGEFEGNISGGVNNFPRFAERWFGVDSVINGSMVGMFRAEQGNSRFLDVNFSGFYPPGRTGAAYSNTALFDGSSCVYTAPNRRWTFDEALTQSVSNLPPGTPRVVATDRLRWVRR